MTAIDAIGTRPRASLWAVPEVTVAFLSFCLHYVWEFLQVPTCAGMAEMNHWDGVKLCTSATVGDVGFALTAFWITSAASRSRQWIAAPKGRPRRSSGSVPSRL